MSIDITLTFLVVIGFATMMLVLIWIIYDNFIIKPGKNEKSIFDYNLYECISCRRTIIDLNEKYCKYCGCTSTESLNSHIVKRKEPLIKKKNL